LKGPFGRELMVFFSIEISIWLADILVLILVRDSLAYQPERSTVIAMYKKLVVGVAIITSPLETYITYLAVKAGWDKAQIGRFVLRNSSPERINI